MPQNTSAPGRIVVGVDTSDNATRAALWAAREAEARGLALHVVHALNLPAVSAMPLEPPEYAAKQHAYATALLDTVIGKVRDQYPETAVTVEVSELSAPQTLVTLSRNARLVVTGTRGHGGFAGLLLGSVSLKLAAHSHCPAVVVRGEEPGEPLNEVVLGIEPGEHEAPIRYAFDAAFAYGAALRVVRAWQPEPMREEESMWSTSKATTAPRTAGMTEESEAVQIQIAPSRSAKLTGVTAGRAWRV